MLNKQFTCFKGDNRDFKTLNIITSKLFNLTYYVSHFKTVICCSTEPNSPRLSSQCSSKRSKRSNKRIRLINVIAPLSETFAEPMENFEDFFKDR